ncbi:hypothetical protein SOJ16_002114 [Caldicellulosiruptor danielii]|uniref:N-acetyltransferase domain-containing protein n=1 Tax=Anaerocellum danielii TaxID=1387557 RepID=A0ABZ0TXS9_9FIRM|nr:hypothetical protein [Caldicellulosiruptor danielii]WPX08247.1 hypothetical protein SOJ16_002114 [Caldicellulosiruptor danielii]
MIDFIIRPIKLQDATAINQIRRMDGVMENTLGIFSERVSSTEEFIKGLSENDRLLVAEVNENGEKRWSELYRASCQ